MCPIDKDCLLVCNAAHKDKNGEVLCAAIDLGHGVCLWDAREWVRAVREAKERKKK